MTAVQIVEVGPRDGFQSIGPFIPTARKVAVLRGLHAAGLRRIEVASFVSPAAAPQMADAADLVRAAADLDGLDAQVLVPTARHAERALEAGARHLVFVLSVSESHNRGNVRRSPAESVAEYGRVAALAPEGARLRLNLATAFDCPYEGRIALADAVALLEALFALRTPDEVALCDTTGRVSPDHVERLFWRCSGRLRLPGRWAFHAHDTFGLGAANAFAAWRAGVRVFDASVAGLGGCPFAPGATGNVATEDLVWMFAGMGVPTGVDLDRLVDVARDATILPGAQVGGRVRRALEAAARRAAP